MEDAPGFVHAVPPAAEDVRAQGQEEDVDLLQRDGVSDTAHRAQRVNNRRRRRPRGHPTHLWH